MSLQVQPSSVSQFVLVNLRSSTTGQLLTGIDNTEITVSYWRPGAVAPVAESSITAGTLGTYGAKTWIEYSTTGRYQYCPSNAAIASGVPYVDLLFTATGAIDKVERIWLMGVPNVAAGEENGLVFLGTNNADVSFNDFNVQLLNLDQIVTTAGQVRSNIVQVAGQTASATGAVDFDDLGAGGGDATAANQLLILNQLQGKNRS